MNAKCSSISSGWRWIGACLVAASLFPAALTPPPAHAQTGKPLEKAEPPPPPEMPRDDAVEPQVTIRQEGSRTVKEYRLNGRLYMMQVSEGGRTFYLIDERGDGQFTRRESLDSGLRVPLWVIKSW